RVRENEEPSRGSVKPAKAHFRRASLFGLPQILPPGFELLDVFTVNGRFPAQVVQLIRRKPDVIAKWLVAEIQGTIRQSRPSHRWDALEKRAQFQRSRKLALSRIHMANPASRHVFGEHIRDKTD